MLSPQYLIIPHLLWQPDSDAFIGNSIPWPKRKLRDLLVYHKFFYSNYSNMQVMLKTHHVSELMDIFNPICITLSQPSMSKDGTPKSTIPDLSQCGISSIVQNMPRSSSLSSDKDGILLKSLVQGQHSFAESIGGEESPSTSNCIALLARYGFNSYGFCAVLSGETNGPQCPLLLHCTTLHSMPHWHDATKSLVAIRSLQQLDYGQMSLWSRPGIGALPVIT